MHCDPEARQRDAPDGLALASIYEEAGVPPGVINVLTTSEPSHLGAAVLADPRVRKLSFTGSTGVGRLLLAEAAKHVVSCSMELGGNAPFIVFDDADLDAAIDGAMVAKMRNAGEACTAANRLYIQSGIYNAFAEALTKRMEALNVGAGIDPLTECGPMITQKAVEKIDRLVNDAKGQRGARPLRRGDGHADWFLLPANGARGRFGRCRYGTRGDFWASSHLSTVLKRMKRQ